MHARLSEVHLNFIVHALNDKEDEERGGNGGRDKAQKQRPRRVTEDFLPMHYTLVRPNTQTFLIWGSLRTFTIISNFFPDIGAIRSPKHQRKSS